MAKLKTGYIVKPHQNCSLDERARVKGLLWEAVFRANTLFATENEAVIASHKLGEDAAYLTIIRCRRERVAIR